VRATCGDVHATCLVAIQKVSAIACSFAFSKTRMTMASSICVGAAMTSRLHARSKPRRYRNNSRATNRQQPPQARRHLHPAHRHRGLEWDRAALVRADVSVHRRRTSSLSASSRKRLRQRLRQRRYLLLRRARTAKQPPRKSRAHEGVAEEQRKRRPLNALHRKPFTPNRRPRRPNAAERRRRNPPDAHAPRKLRRQRQKNERTRRATCAACSSRGDAPARIL